MEDYFKSLLVVGIIGASIYKYVSKSRQAEETPRKRPAPRMQEIAPDATPVPEYWGERGGLLETSLMEEATPKSKKKKKEEISVSASIANTLAQDERNARQAASHNNYSESSDGEEEFAICSVEDARRAIVWGEILHRKY